jgi:putative CocE/NonD family hydrolase
MTMDSAHRVQSLYVPVSDGVRLAIDVWLPVERIARGEWVGAVFRATRYHRAVQPPGPEPEADSNRAAGELWTRAGFALIVADARGTGASFGSRSMELGPREIADYGELIDWVAAQPWSNGRVGVYGTSYEGQAAELVASLGNPHVVAVAALFSPVDPYRELFYPGGCATGGRFARWMCESQIQDGVAGAVERLAELTGRSLQELALPAPVKPVDGPDGPALLEAAIGEHQANVDMNELLGLAPFSDDRLPGLDWQATTPAAARQAIEATGVPMLVRAGWLDGAFAAGALQRFATFSNKQEVEIGPWGHGGGTFADTLRPDGMLAGDLLRTEGQDRRLVEFFTRYVERAETPDGRHTMTFGTLGTDRWQTVGSWPPEGVDVRTWYLAAPGRLESVAGPETDLRHVPDPAASTGPTNRWLAVDLGRGAAYGDRRHADEALLTFTSDPLPADLHVAGFPVISLRLATSGSDGAIYAYLEDVAPDGEVVYVTEGCLRFLHRATRGPAEPTRLGVPRSFARADRLAVTPGQDLDLAVELLPVAALIRAGHKIRVALGGHDAACFDRYGPPDETFTVQLGEHSTLDLPILTSGRVSGSAPRT